MFYQNGRLIFITEWDYESVKQKMAVWNNLLPFDYFYRAKYNIPIWGEIHQNTEFKTMLAEYYQEIWINEARKIQSERNDDDSMMKIRIQNLEAKLESLTANGKEWLETKKMLDELKGESIKEDDLDLGIFKKYKGTKIKGYVKEEWDNLDLSNFEAKDLNELINKAKNKK